MNTPASMQSKGRKALAKVSEVAEYLGTSPSQLARLRFEGKGPTYVKLGRSVRYRWGDVEAWVAAGTRETKKLAPSRPC